MINKKYFSLLVIGGIVTSLALTSSVFAEGNEGLAPGSHNIGGSNGMGRGRVQNRIPGIFGTVSAISGTTLTVTSKLGPKGDEKGDKEDNNKTTSNTNVSTTTYTIDASTATVIKNGATATVANIALGDTVMVEGTVTGTSVVAKIIRAGIMTKNTMPNKKEDSSSQSPTNLLIAGNGQPIVAGTVTIINGSTVTITNKSNVTYTVDATNAKIQKGNASGTITSIAVGDAVVVQGTVSGTNITASSVIDQGSTTDTTKKESKGFFKSIGSFFGHLFGF